MSVFLARTLIKICGVTRVEDALQIAELGVDIIGLNFVAGSPREVSLAAARAIVAATHDRVEIWGLFVDAEPAKVQAVLEVATLSTLQFNGSESAEECAAYGLPWVKAVHMRDGVDFVNAERCYASARMLLLDTWAAGMHGGTGKRFDWSLWPAHSETPLMLAGGLDPDNVAEAVTRLKPAGVDVAGGVEGEVKGLKDLDRCRRFITSVRAAESAHPREAMQQEQSVETVRR